MYFTKKEVTNMTEQDKLNFEALFSRAGEYGSFNDLKKPNPELANSNAPPQDSQLRNEVGPDGLTLFSRRGRIRITDTGPVREQGCSSVDGFFDTSSEKADETLF
jgi:hypothetical protein